MMFKFYDNARSTLDVCHSKDLQKHKISIKFQSALQCGIMVKLCDSARSRLDVCHTDGQYFKICKNTKSSLIFNGTMVKVHNNV